MKDNCAVSHQVTDFPSRRVMLCALVELDCVTRISATGRERDSVDALHGLEGMHVEIFAVGGEGRCWHGWAGGVSVTQQDWFSSTDVRAVSYIASQPGLGCSERR